MLARLVCGAMLLAATAASTGCCCATKFCHKSCQAGCGEVYWSEWHNDPPDCCDPCDCWGEFAGHGYCAECHGAEVQGCGKCRAAGPCCESGSCGGQPPLYDEMPPEMVESYAAPGRGAYVARQSTPAPKPVRAAKRSGRPTRVAAR